MADMDKLDKMLNYYITPGILNAGKAKIKHFIHMKNLQFAGKGLLLGIIVGFSFAVLLLI